MANVELKNGDNSDIQNGSPQKEDNSSEPELTCVEGIYLPRQTLTAQPWEERIQDLRQLKLRDDDVILLTYPKAGTNWLWETISMLRKGTAEHDPRSKVQFMMEFVHNDVLNGLPSPRTLNTHLPLSMLPVPEMKARRIKLVHVYRNPKDTCVSLYHMTKSSPRMSGSYPIKSFEDFAERYFFSDKQIFGSFSKYFKQIHEFQQQNPDMPIIHCSYEDVKKEPVACVEKLAEFLDLTVSKDLCARIADECSFVKMKAKEAEKEMPKTSAKPQDGETVDKMKKQRPAIFRKGQVGDWKNYFVVALNERVDALIEQQMKTLPFKLTFE